MTRMTAELGEQTDRLARGEAVPGGPGACAGCHHAKVWHSPGSSKRSCSVDGCGCRTWLLELPAVDGDQLSLLGSA